ncbi:hypothetical protein [Sorangium sp. So ce341]|uniref:hypothetical protein n=1 Tax=Sorangium sp. So ce341 TaxID=3133302 RepID=UPI003F5DD2C2
MLAAPPAAQPCRRARLLAAALLAVCACQPAAAPPAHTSQDAPLQSGAATPSSHVAAPASRPAPAAAGDSAAQPAQKAAGDRAPGAGAARTSSLDGRSPVKLAPPPFDQALFRPAPAGSSAAPRLVKIAEQKNKITDEEAWFTTNGLSLPTLQIPGAAAGEAGGSRPVPSFVPESYRDQPLVKAIDHGDHLALFYGPSFAAERFVAILDAAHRVVAFFDFKSFLMPPEIAPDEAEFVRGHVGWAVVKDGVLYVSSGHRTYAASSKGKNAYLSAIDLASGQLLWQSAPLVCNAENFVLRGDHLLCGYGFTAEPDFLYVLERATGKVASKLSLKSGPAFLVEKDGKLFVRTYDTDYVFEIR